MPYKSTAPALLLAISLTTLLTACKEEPATAAAPPPPKVGIVTLQAQAFTLTSELPGRTSAYRIAEVRPQVNGIILKRLFTEGREVKAGQQLYQIDPALYASSLKSAQATLQSSQSLAERYKLLVDEQAVSRQEFDEARAKQLEAQAALQTATINLRYTKVLAPIAGRIGRSAVSEGALVSDGQSSAMAVIQQLDPIYVDVTQSSLEILKLRNDLASGRLQKTGNNAATVKLLLEDGSEYPQAGQLEFSEVSVDTGTGSVTLRAVFPNPKHDLLPGMFVHAQLQAGVSAQAILAPQQGVTRNLQGKPTALVVNQNNQVELRELQAERTTGNSWLINQGLQAGDRLIVEGLQFVKPGVSVTVSEASNLPTNQATTVPAAGKGE